MPPDLPDISFDLFLNALKTPQSQSAKEGTRQKKSGRFGSVRQIWPDPADLVLSGRSGVYRLLVIPPPSSFKRLSAHSG